MRVDVPTLIIVHYIAHCEALVAEDATRAFLQFQMLCHFANKAYEWVGKLMQRVETIVKGCI